MFSFMHPKPSACFRQFPPSVSNSYDLSIILDEDDVPFKTLVYKTMSNNATSGSLLLTMKLSRFVLFTMGNDGLAAVAV